VEANHQSQTVESPHKPRSFRMEILAAVLRLLRPGFWGATIVLKDVYLHVPILYHSRKWLRFRIGGGTFEFRVLPFGLSTSPRVFARGVRVVAEFLRPRGYTLSFFLDVFLVVGPSRGCLLRDRGVFAVFSADWGSFSTPKSYPVPAGPVPRGHSRLCGGGMFPTAARVVVLLACASLVRAGAPVEVCLFVRLLGLTSGTGDFPLVLTPHEAHAAAPFLPLQTMGPPIYPQYPSTPSHCRGPGGWLDPFEGSFFLVLLPPFFPYDGRVVKGLRGSPSEPSSVRGLVPVPG